MPSKIDVSIRQFYMSSKLNNTRTNEKNLTKSGTGIKLFIHDPNKCIYDLYNYSLTELWVSNIGVELRKDGLNDAENHRSDRGL